MTFQMFDLEEVGQGHGVQRVQSRRSMANINVHKSRNPYIFAPALIISDILTVQMFDLEEVGQGHRVQRSHGRIRW